ncbi:hypothetical protein B0H12DRAFT_1234387 [Mycena haematopus]|nr:hypothetical protein B0H12DRAFT_1234387 [Mycena haematopus]
MVSKFVFRALSVAFIGLGFANHVDGSPHPVTDDIHCPTDAYTSFIHNSYTYKAPLHKFTNITKSFFDISWYAGTIVTNTTGTDNVPGATRSGPYAGTTYNETLTAIDTTRPDALEFSDPAVREHLRWTYIDVITYLCSDNQLAVYTTWYMIHMSAFAALAAKLGAPIMAGDCPQESHCYKS